MSSKRIFVRGTTFQVLVTSHTLYVDKSNILNTAIGNQSKQAVIRSIFETNTIISLLSKAFNIFFLHVSIFGIIYTNIPTRGLQWMW